MTRVLVVDDHHFFRSCLVDMINASGDVVVIAECPDGGQVLLTSDTAESSRAAARASGVVGYLIKGSDPDLILDALRHAGPTSTTSADQSSHTTASTGTQSK